MCYTTARVIYDVNMDYEAMNIVQKYIDEQYAMEGKPLPAYNIYTVWKAKALKNWKYLISTTIKDQMYYELTYNGEKKQWYLDAYDKKKNIAFDAETKLPIED